MITKADMGWMAAIIDMKGRINTKTNPNRKTPQVVLRVETTNDRVAAKLSAMSGTKPEPKPLPDTPGGIGLIRRGCKEHCPEAHIHVDEQHDYPDSTKWTITGTPLAIVLWNLRPHMATYEDYAPITAMLFTNATLRGRGSAASLSAVGRLKKLGWQIPEEIDKVLAADAEPMPQAAMEGHGNG